MTIRGDISKGTTVHEEKIINRIARDWLLAHRALLMEADDFLFFLPRRQISHMRPPLTNRRRSSGLRLRSSEELSLSLNSEQKVRKGRSKGERWRSRGLAPCGWCHCSDLRHWKRKRPVGQRERGFYFLTASSDGTAEPLGSSNGLVQGPRDSNTTPSRWPNSGTQAGSWIRVPW